MTVEQSVIWAMVVVSLLGSPLCVCKVGEGPFSLNHPRSHYPAHLNYSIMRKNHQLWPVYAFCPCFSKALVANWKKIFVLVYSVACRVCVVGICCHLRRNSCGMRSAMWCVAAVPTWAWAPVAWRAMMWRFMKGSGVTPAGVMVAVTPVSRVVWAGSGMTEPVPISIIMVGMPGVAMMPRWGSIMPTGVISVAHWCAWRWYFVRAVCNNISIVVTVKTSYVRTIVCHMAGFLTLETLVIVTGHGIDQWSGY